MTGRGSPAAALVVILALVSAEAAARPPSPGEIETCLRTAARVHRVDPAMLVVLLQVEGGSLGRVSRNTDGSVDIGPMQVNSRWLPQLAGRWRSSVEPTYLALRDNFCANVEAGAWILRLALDDAGGDFWKGVSFYHSRTPRFRERYLAQVLRRAERLARAAPHALPGELAAR